MSRQQQQLLDKVFEMINEYTIHTDFTSPHCIRYFGKYKNYYYAYVILISGGSVLYCSDGRIHCKDIDKDPFEEESMLWFNHMSCASFLVDLSQS